jgi:hypothetical protein
MDRIFPHLMAGSYCVQAKMARSNERQELPMRTTTLRKRLDALDDAVANTSSTDILAWHRLADVLLIMSKLLGCALDEEVDI